MLVSRPSPPLEDPYGTHQMSAYQCHQPTPAHPPGTKSSNNCMVPAGLPDSCPCDSEPRQVMPPTLESSSWEDRGCDLYSHMANNGIDAGDGTKLAESKAPSSLDPPDRAKRLVGGRHKDHCAVKSRWDWLRLLIQAFRRLGRDQTSRTDRKHAQHPLTLLHPRPRTPSATVAISASQQPSASGDEGTQNRSESNSRVPPQLSFPLQMGTEGVATGLEGRVNTSFAMFEGLNRAHVSGGTFYEGQTINVYYVNPVFHGYAPQEPHPQAPRRDM
ncbi:hypothetical protein BKA70DRAFT_1272944 [Coprinopsis sp. MPI-PUGE-AT-0042]|nr:hypothetical protein BKA70DRAFT_1272944 [Coprinopsis sp. MPI-PUGE-AT-0042]